VAPLRVGRLAPYPWDAWLPGAPDRAEREPEGVGRGEEAVEAAKRPHGGKIDRVVAGEA
jgi:hypothetical protein